MSRLIALAVALFGAVCAAGASVELLANFFPVLLPDTVRETLEASLYGELHGDPVVHWWLRISNVANLAAGLGLVWAATRLRSARGVRVAEWAFGWFVLSAVVGGTVLVGWVFPVLDAVEKFPVPIHVMKASMLSAPFGLVVMAAVLVVSVRRKFGRPAAASQPS